MDGAREVAWAVTRAGCGRGQVTGDFAALVSEVEATWANLFPRRLGYTTRTEARSDNVVRLEVRRGDFEGHVELCCDFDRHDAVRIRALASARSQRMIAAELAGQRVIRRARAIATAIGALICVGFCWLAAGVEMPVVGGLMLSIITACVLVGGGNLGSRIGEGMAAWRRLDAERAVSADIGVQADIRRWNSLNRQLRGHRRALARGLGSDPFRRAALGA
ncbi:MAG TPA: hypothetical protein VK034_18200 [Enhygromyxa sp.]|nr:hypothetical protein [Enhygromyxa sp.]